MTSIDTDRDDVTADYRYDRETMDPSSHVVVDVVADALNRSPLDLEPLYYRVDPEALDGLVDRSLGTEGGENTAVHFDFAGCHVAVTPFEVRIFTGESE